MSPDLLEDQDVAKGKGGWPKGKKRPSQATGEGVQVRIDADIVAKLRYLSAAKKEPMTELVSRLLRGPVELMFKRAAHDIEDASRGAGRGPESEEKGRETEGGSI